MATRPQNTHFKYEAREGHGIVVRQSLMIHTAGDTPAPPIGAGGDTFGFTDHGGPKLLHVRVQLIFWGAAWNSNPPPATTAEAIDQAVGKILDSPYMSALSQYGVGYGSKLPPVVITTSNPPANFTDSDVQTFVTGLLDNDQLPEPDEQVSPFYCVVMPPNVNNQNSGFIGEHFFFYYTDEENPNQGDAAAVAWVTNDGTLDYVTTIFSHELVEACTDPQGSAILGNPGTCNQSGWCEIGDVCNTVGTVNGVTVQSYWSQKDKACIVPTKYPISHWLDMLGVLIDTHRSDPAWLIALWLAIHHGDRSPEMEKIRQFTTVSLLNALAGDLPSVEQIVQVQKALEPALEEAYANAVAEVEKYPITLRVNEDQITALSRQFRHIVAERFSEKRG